MSRDDLKDDPAFELQDLTTIGFDADDTLWRHEDFYRRTEDQLLAQLAERGDPGALSSRLLEIERRNLPLYGFGVKAFTLSMIEMALETRGEALTAAFLEEILAAGRALLRHPIELLPYAHETLSALAGVYRLVLITKGDLFDQERKLVESGLIDYFDAVEIVADKNVATYRRLFDRHGDGPARAMMVGNSLKSDIIPAIEAGGWGVHVPYALTWGLEHAEAPQEAARYRRLSHLGELTQLVSPGR
jgi:putative hydrolase of the HAD superfamily